MVRAVRINMIMHGNGSSGIQRQHGLEIEDNPKLKDVCGKFTLILSNPPFAGFEIDESIFNDYETSKK